MENKYRKPWKVVYETHWKTGELVVHEGKKIVDRIVDCDKQEVVITDSGCYPPEEDVAEYIVKCVNERKDDEDDTRL